MPINLPHRDPDTGQLVESPHYEVAELADMLHVSASHVRRQAGVAAWPHLRLANRIWFSAAHVDRILELCTVDPDAIPTGHVPQLGTPLSDVDLEGVR